MSEKVLILEKPPQQNDACLFSTELWVELDFNELQQK